MPEAPSYLRGRTLRTTRTDACGNPAPGPDSVAVSSGFVSLGFTANTEEGETITVTNANGDICVNDVPAPRFMGYSVEGVFCNISPAQFTIMTGQPVVLDASGDPVGFKMNTKINLDERGFALEVWTGVAGTVCEPGQTTRSGYILTPFLKGGILGDFTVENGALNFTITGASTKDGTNWGVGPFMVVLDADNAPSPLLEPLDPNDHLLVIPTYVAPPEPTDGGAALGEPAAGATAGSPGTYTPANTYGPGDFAELSTAGITADPVTTWESGQYIVLRDGSRATWDGTDWVAA